MKDEALGEKWDRLQGQVQDGILNGYPNPERKGCPGSDAIVALAMRAVKFDDAIEDDPQWVHVTHCSPCYGQYLEAFHNLRLRKPAVAAE
jgi:hypothetical protein